MGNVEDTAQGGHYPSPVLCDLLVPARFPGCYVERHSLCEDKISDD